MRNVLPNLPQGNVSVAFVSELLPANIVNSIEAFETRCVRLKPSGNILSELRYHPDILILNTEKGVWTASEDTCEQIEHAFASRGIPDICKFAPYGESPGDKYPDDCLFNCFAVDGALVIGKKSRLDVSARKIPVNQGYAKCSTVIVNKDSFITSDRSIAGTLAKLGKNVLYTDSNSYIKLNGYSCGFIGGTCGKLSENLLAFLGNIKALPDYENIKAFTQNVGVYIEALSDDDLYDYGGLLPVFEDNGNNETTVLA